MQSETHPHQRRSFGNRPQAAMTLSLSPGLTVLGRASIKRSMEDTVHLVSGSRAAARNTRPEGVAGRGR